MIYVVTILHVITCFVLILVVLLQTGKRADLAGAFGGGGSQTAFGTRGAATLLSKLTTSTAVIFMVTSITLSIMSAQFTGETGSVVEDASAPQTEAAAAGEEQAPADLPALPTDPEGTESTPAENPADAPTE